MLFYPVSANQMEEVVCESGLVLLKGYGLSIPVSGWAIGKPSSIGSKRGALSMLFLYLIVHCRLSFSMNKAS